MTTFEPGLDPTSEKLVEYTTSILFQDGLNKIKYKVEDSNGACYIDNEYERVDSIVRRAVSIRYLILYI